MKYFKLTVIVSLVLLTFYACDSDDSNSEPFSPKFVFTFNWNGESVESSDFNTIKYTNRNGEELSITRMRYLMSNIIFVKPNGEEIVTEEFNFIDLSNASSLTFNSQEILTSEEFASIKFDFGFNQVNNQGNYPSLNIENWNWPTPLGGGYHNMQYEGKFINANNEEQFYALHMGTRRPDQDGTDNDQDGDGIPNDQDTEDNSIFEQNHFTINAVINTVLNGSQEIEVQMNIAQWFENPNTWDLNELNAPLMPNYNAQVLMQENGPSVFSLAVNN
jgi:hypothetical protein